MADHLFSPVDTTKAAPSRSILKKKARVECSQTREQEEKAEDTDNKHAKWDEMNIMATYHPADKDYGHMKIDDPPTPYHEYRELADGVDELPPHAPGTAVSDSVTIPSKPLGHHERKASFSERTDELDAAVIAQRLASDSPPKAMMRAAESEEEEEEEDAMSREERERKAAFERKRRMHYDEFLSVRLLKQLPPEDEDDDDNDRTGSANGKNVAEEQMDIATDDRATSPAT